MCASDPDPIPTSPHVLKPCICGEQAEAYADGSSYCQHCGRLVEAQAAYGFTPKSIEDAKRLLPQDPPIYGIACCPAVAEKLKSVEGFSPPILIDLRLFRDRSEIFYDAALWKARCEEQAQWDTLDSAGQRPAGAAHVERTETEIR